MALWHKSDGRAPGDLPEFAYDADGNSWSDLANSSAARAATGWILAPEYPDYDSETQTPVWNSSDLNWIIVDKPTEPDIFVPVKVTKSEFSRLFTNGERGALIVARRTFESMSPADLAQIENMGWVYLGIIFENLEFPAEYIELNHPDTITAINEVLVPMGILTSERAAEVLSNNPPT